MKRAVRFFNTTGPCNPDDHYMLPPEERLVGAQLGRYISDNLYWVLHAPRQTGKTTFLQNWMREINAGTEALACYVSVERCQSFPDAKRAIPAVCSAIRDSAIATDIPVPDLPEGIPEVMMGEMLASWAAMVAPKKLVVLFDEVDVLQDEALITFLRLLREGFATRGVGKFPTSIALVGMRDLRDYITAAKGGVAPNPGSPFNVKADSAVLGNFTRPDIARLFAQRTRETGQEITDEALDYAWAQSCGQPWIVNSLFMRATMRLLPPDSAETVTLRHLEETRAQMIEARETHLDALGKRLSDPRVKRVIQTILTGDLGDFGREDDDVQYVLDLGLVRWTPETNFTIANPIYAEILTRNLNSRYHDNATPPPASSWRREDGSLDMDGLLREFQKFWRRHSEIWEGTAEYTEAFPHLLLMAFLQRVTNGGGRIDRECASGRGRMDLLVEYGGERNIVEIKLLRDRDSRKDVLAEGLLQVREYRDRFGKGVPCYLVIFDRRSRSKRLPWSRRIQWKKHGDVTVLGC
ncbi:MAG: ATP-binding protein [Acidobacteriota bacterium]|jgi:hypothetical protein|nr:ATP-binding protein [Acidobacteriota bacterium]